MTQSNGLESRRINRFLCVSASLRPRGSKVSEVMKSVDSVKSENTTPIPGSSRELCFMSARDLAGLIRLRKLSAREVMTAYLDQINRFNPTLNAIVARLDDERCIALADAADRRASQGETLGPLHGLPIAFKDLEA